eukprot:CAMPEP_0179848250 /NCGR_PEP_ID=MMETSP0982-20121206/6522_1 /TAXON_ID=483367 /ORGANISM="non described non described, Strain CCMP 2436" /LENGTH=44 /DNA_ID= /DNA_START= /DNA_END= /DNA_ORIENTATION=
MRGREGVRDGVREVVRANAELQAVQSVILLNQISKDKARDGYQI